MSSVTDDEWDATSPGNPPSGAKVAIQAGLFVLAVLLLVWLWNVLRAEPFWEGFAHAMSETVWVIILLVLLGIILVVEVLLLRPSYVHAVLPDAWLADEDPLYRIGCSGCGTIFERHHSEVDEEHEKHFVCPNCGRAGLLPSLRKKKAEVHDLWCGHCSTHYQAYRPDTECPHCHTPQSGE